MPTATTNAADAKYGKGNWKKGAGSEHNQIKVWRSAMTPSGAYVLQHEYEDENGDEQVKFIGIYSTEIKAKAAIDRLKQISGFKQHPEGFIINYYELDKDHWVEGFIHVAPGESL